jgi:hypothetical protein
MLSIVSPSLKVKSKFHIKIIAKKDLAVGLQKMFLRHNAAFPDTTRKKKPQQALRPDGEKAKDCTSRSSSILFRLGLNMEKHPE